MTAGGADGGPAAELAPMVELWFRILVEHVADAEGRCRVCTSPGTGARRTPWPCALHALAAQARRRHAALAGPPGRRLLHGERGTTCPMTPREREFLQMAADGRDDADIAAQLGVPERTVRFTIRRITRKLGVDDRAALIVLALRAGVVV